MLCSCFDVNGNIDSFVISVTLINVDCIYYISVSFTDRVTCAISVTKLII